MNELHSAQGQPQVRVWMSPATQHYHGSRVSCLEIRTVIEVILATCVGGWSEHG